MRVLKYLTGDILSHTLAVSMVLFLVVFSGRFIKYLAEAAVGDLPSEVLLPVMLYKLPSFFELILPLGLFVGLLLSLGRLYADSEMVVLKACGLSPERLVGYVMFPALVITLLVASLSLLLAPAGSARAQTLLDNPRTAEGLQQLVEGRFKKQQDGNFVSYAERIDDAGVMHNVFVVQRKPGNPAAPASVTFAKEGQFLYDDIVDRRYLELREGTRYRGVPGQADYEAVSFERYGELIPEIEGGLRASVKVDAIPSLALWHNDEPAARAALMWRLSLPILVPVIAIIAVALSRTDARRGRYARLGPALLVFLVYFLALTQSRGLIEAGGSVWSVVAVHLGFTGLAIGLLKWESLRMRFRGLHRG